MASYTVEVRTICENYLLEAKPDLSPWQVADMEATEVIPQVWNKIVRTTWNSFGILTPENVATAILKHYYMREIGLETVAFWRHCLNTRLDEILPKYLAYEEKVSELGSIFENINITDIMDRNFGRVESENQAMENKMVGETSGAITGEGNQKNVQNTTSSMSGNSSNTDTQTQTQNEQKLFSDTPQNGLNDVIQGKYLTTANIDSANSESSNTSTGEQSSSGKEDVNSSIDTTSSQNTTGTEKRDSTGTIERSGNMNDTEDRKNVRTGWNGDKMEMLEKYWEFYHNSLQGIVEDVADLFIGIL